MDKEQEKLLTLRSDLCSSNLARWTSHSFWIYMYSIYIYILVVAIKLWIFGTLSWAVARGPVLRAICQVTNASQIFGNCRRVDLFWQALPRKNPKLLLRIALAAPGYVRFTPPAQKALGTSLKYSPSKIIQAQKNMKFTLVTLHQSAAW